jgi:tRNA A-37 threonylcarbamoyl transferase component Bud32
MNERLAAVLEDPEVWLRAGARLFKGFDRSSTVGAADGLVLKRYNFRKPVNVLKDWFRPSRAARAFHSACGLESRGIATPRVLAFAERRCCRVLLTSYLVAEEIPNARGLGDYLANVLSPDRRLIVEMGRLIARLHSEGFSHRDLKATNVLLDESLKPYLIDLDGLKDRRTVSASRAAADLERLARGVLQYPNITRAHRVLFMMSYCRARGLVKTPLRGKRKTS